MIPADVASRMQVSAEAAMRPVAPTQEITDKLSDLVAGQRVMAEIQALLPNGTYRALINQRNITLALPFSAKSGDTLELQVTESDGKIALAVVSHQEADGGKTAREAVSATLSRTGQLISQLFSGARGAKNDDAALALNGNRPIANTPPATAQDILPQLKQAISESGMFYESHQAEWVEGRFPKNALLQEPQGKLSSPAAFAPPSPAATPTESKLPGQALPNAATPSENRLAQAVMTDAPQKAAADTLQKVVTDIPQKVVADLPQSQSPGQLIAPQTQPIVQQQLEALATQNFVWQGQVWPGQEMRWEIEGDGGKRGQDGEEPAESWRTRLRLSLPHLGGINARIQIHGDQLIVAIAADRTEARALMQTESESLRRQLNEAGLTLTSLGIGEEPAESAHEEAKER